MYFVENYFLLSEKKKRFFLKNQFTDIKTPQREEFPININNLIYSRDNYLNLRMIFKERLRIASILLF